MDQSSSSSSSPSNVPPPTSSSSTMGSVPSPIIQQHQERNIGGKSGNSTPTPEAELNPQKVKILLQKLKEEMILAKSSTNDDEKRKHLETVEKIKRILVKYQQQQQAKANSNNNNNNINNNNSNSSGDDKGSVTLTPSQPQQSQQQQVSKEVQSSSQLSQPAIQSQPSVSNSPLPLTSQSQSPKQPSPPIQIQSQPSSQPSSQSPPQSRVPSVSSPSLIAPSNVNSDQKNTPTPPSIQSPTPQRPTVRPQQQVTTEKYNSVRTTLKTLLEKIKALESSKNVPGITNEKKEEIDKHLVEIRGQMQKYHTAALHMRNILIEQGRLSANSTPVNGNQNSSVSTPIIEKSNLIKAEEIKPNTKPQIISVTNTKLKQKAQSTTNIPLSATTKIATTAPASTSASAAASATTTANSTTGTTTPVLTKAASTTKLNRPGLNQTPTSATTAATPATTTSTSTPAATTAAATTTTTNTNNATSATAAKQQSQQPAVDPKVTPSNIPDNDGRVLTKRKLTELINNISVDQGDVKIPIDNDVEDLFLDLADDFVRNIVEFSGRLAKHRKLDRIDIRDVQLNLERNWGLRIPGYATDEIKAARKWQANPEYIEKVNEISKLNKKE